MASLNPKRVYDLTHLGSDYDDDDEEEKVSKKPKLHGTDTKMTPVHYREIEIPVKPAKLKLDVYRGSLPANWKGSRIYLFPLLYFDEIPKQIDHRPVAADGLVCEDENYCRYDSNVCVSNKTVDKFGWGLHCGVVKSSGQHISRHVWTYHTDTIINYYRIINNNVHGSNSILPVDVIMFIKDTYRTEMQGKLPDDHNMIQGMIDHPEQIVLLFWVIDIMLFQGRISQALQDIDYKLFLEIDIKTSDLTKFADTTFDGKNKILIRFYTHTLTQFRSYTHTPEWKYNDHHYTRLEFLIETLLHEIVHVIQYINWDVLGESEANAPSKYGYNHGPFYDSVYASIFGIPLNDTSDRQVRDDQTIIDSVINFIQGIF